MSVEDLPVVAVENVPVVTIEKYQLYNKKIS
jgi:hypothetical protein